MRTLITALCLAAVSASARAQAVTIDPGMTQAQVVAKLGEPVSAHSYGGFTYMLYKNGCEKKCGMNDLVVLDSGKVSDAIFRSPNRKYSGKSSSPQMITANEARKEGETKTGAPLKLNPPQPKKPPTA